MNDDPSFCNTHMPIAFLVRQTKLCKITLTIYISDTEVQHL